MTLISKNCLWLLTFQNKLLDGKKVIAYQDIGRRSLRLAWYDGLALYRQQFGERAAIVQKGGRGQRRQLGLCLGPPNPKEKVFFFEGLYFQEKKV